MAKDPWFEVEVECRAGGNAHRHRIRVTSTPRTGIAFLPRAPRVAGQRQLEYSCPISGKVCLSHVSPPAGFDAPFRVLSVK
jgi:hypothetical protein